MPRAEDNKESLETGQRYGLMEGERSVSGQKRICFCWGYTQSWCENRFIPFCLIILYPVIYILGFYSGFTSNCNCNCNNTNIH